MKKVFLLFIVLWVFCANLNNAESQMLTPAPQRITDEVIASDISVIKGLQERLVTLNNKGLSASGYHFSKAQAWIDFALDEYTENDRSPVVEDALKEALDIIKLLEAGTADISMQTPVIQTSSRVRNDLWEKAEALKKQNNFSCAESTVARLEVMLVWAGHEEREFGWRHAMPYLQAAERLLRESEEIMVACQQRSQKSAETDAKEMEVRSKGLPEVGLLPPQKLSETEPLPDRVHFAVDEYAISDATSPVLDRIASIMRAQTDITVELYGHADERGTDRYNIELSRKRAEKVRNYLMAAGIASERIRVKAFGKESPAVPERNREAYARNRRVEFLFTGGKGLTKLHQEHDLQPE